MFGYTAIQGEHVPHTMTDSDVLAPLVTVSRRHDVDALAEHLQTLQVFLASDLRDVAHALETIGDECITHASDHSGDSRHSDHHNAPSSPTRDRVSNAKHHLLALAGKRIRPLCVLLAARLGKHAFDATVRDVAVACELVHAATLLHDDVIDDSAERRGAPCARVLYGNAASILAGDHLLIEALRLVQHAETNAAAPLLSPMFNVIGQMVAAEAIQLERRGRFEPDRAAYLRVIEGKTASLFVWGLKAGGSVAGMDRAALTALGDVGLNLGLAFQLVDDVLDMDGDPKVLGKHAWADVREGKLTWPMILAAERDLHFCDVLRAMLHEASMPHDQEKTHEGMSDIVERVRRTEALHDTRALALHHADMACTALATLPPSQARDALHWVIESAVHRVR